MQENVQIDKKSLLTVTKANPDWDELAKDSVCFANASGGSIIIGIGDTETLPPTGQKIPSDLPSKIQKIIQGRTVNVGISAIIETAENGGEYIRLIVQRNASSIASTSNGKYYIRIDDQCKPILPDELLRLMNDKTAFVWETQVYLKVKRDDYDEEKLRQFYEDIQNSDRVSSFVKGKSPDELLDIYLFTENGFLTNLGILWIGKRQHRARLQYAPVVQFLKWDENDQRVSKRIWDDYTLNPKELLQSIWNEIPDWKEGIEVTDGIFRKNILNYDETVVRELLANALVHRPYTTRGDIFINLYPDRLEFHNPGLFPLGVTPQNILHRSIQRNPHLAKVFYDLKLMEREGSGYDRIYETLLSQGKPLPIPQEQGDRVLVTVKKRIINKQAIQFIEKLNIEFHLRSKELISLGLIAQQNALTAIEFSRLLGLEGDREVQTWLGRLSEFGLIKTRGKTKGTIYFIEPAILKKHSFKGKTNLRKIEPHRLHHLIIEDLERYGKSAIGDIHQRIGKEIPLRTIRYQLGKLSSEGEIKFEGVNKWRRYFIDK